MARLNSETLDQNRQNIRAAMEQLLNGDIPAGGKCDLKTLAAMAGVVRTGFYPKATRPGPYQHLAEEFQRRLEQLQRTGTVPDPRAAQVDRLKHHNEKQAEHIAANSATIAEMTAFKTLAISRLAAQHDEIERLRASATRPNNLLRLPPRNPGSLIGPC